jgi:hypothetical protein
MRSNILVLAALASAVSAVLSTHANADNEKFRATLSGFEEVGGFPKLNPGTGPGGGNLKPYPARRGPSYPPAMAPSN